MCSSFLLWSAQGVFFCGWRSEDERKKKQKASRDAEAREVGEMGEGEESEVGEVGKSGEGEKKKERTPFDEMMKRLADAYGAELVGYLGGIEGIASCEAVGGEVEMTHRLTDRVYRVKTQKDGEEESFLVHLEFESSYNPRMGRRLGMYGWGLYEKEELPVMHIVWQVGVDAPSYWPEGAWQRRCEETMVLQGELHASVRWREVWLPGGYDAEAFAKQAPTYLLPFAALMKGAKKPFIKRLAEAIMESEAQEDRKQDLLAMAAFFFARVFAMSEILEEIKMSWLEQNPLIDYVKQQALPGLQQGLQQGREEEKREMALKLLEMGMGMEQITKVTGLSAEAIVKMQAQAVGEPSATKEEG